MNIVYVAIGAALGGMSRWYINKVLSVYKPLFPFSTLTVNVISSFLVGVFFGVLLHKEPSNQWIKPLLITGFCGGFSTMSTLSFESLQLISEGRLLIGIFNITLNIILCLLATWFGLACFK